MAYLFQSGSAEYQLSGGVDFQYSNVETDKLMAVNSDAAAPNAAAGTLGLGAAGAGSDGALYWDGSALCVAAAGSKTAHFDGDGLDLVSGDAYLINNTSVLNATTLGTAVVNSSLTSVGTLTGLTVSGDASFQGAAILGNGSDDGVAISGSVITAIIPAQDGADDLGSSSKQWKDLYVNGKAYIDQLGEALDCDNQNMTNVDIDSGAIDGTTIGAASQAAAEFTTVSASSTLTVDGAVQINNGLTIKDTQNIVLGLSADTAMDVDNDVLYFGDDNDSDRLKSIAVGSFLTDIAGSGLAVSSNQLTIETNTVNGALGDENKTLSVGMNYGTSSFTQNRTWTLPALSGLDNGDVVRIKCPPSLDGNTLVVAPNASDKIDDLADGKTLDLMSDNASISLMRVDATQWKIF